MISKNILYIRFLNEPELIFLHTVKWFPLFLSNMNNSIYYLNNYYLLLIICLHIVKCFQVLLFNTNNSMKHQLFLYTQLSD